MISPDRLLPPFTFAKATSPDQRHPERNEDYLLTDQASGLAVICDGVGGVSEASQAARTAARSVRTNWRHMLTQGTYQREAKQARSKAPITLSI